MDRTGVSRHVAVQITGHKTESMYRRYNIVNDADVKAALEKTADYLDSLPMKTREDVQLSPAPVAGDLHVCP